MTSGEEAGSRGCLADGYVRIHPEDIDLIVSRLFDRITEAKKRKKSTVKKTNSHSIDYSSWPCMPDKKLFDDWMKVRKGKKASNTQTAIDGIGRQLHKALELGFSVDDCVREAAERSWSGFKSKWMENIKSQGHSNEGHQRDDRSRAKRVSDELERIAREDIEANGFAETLGCAAVPEVPGEIRTQVD